MPCARALTLAFVACRSFAAALARPMVWRRSTSFWRRYCRRSALAQRCLIRAPPLLVLPAAVVAPPQQQTAITGKTAKKKAAAAPLPQAKPAAEPDAGAGAGATGQAADAAPHRLLPPPAAPALTPALVLPFFFAAPESTMLQRALVVQRLQLEDIDKIICVGIENVLSISRIRRITFASDTNRFPILSARTPTGFE